MKETKNVPQLRFSGFDDEWEEWFIESQKVNVCALYKPPYNFKRTGCAGCPFSLDLQEQLETMKSAGAIVIG